MIVAFFTPSCTFRGTCVALLDYAHYNETLLHNTSIVMTFKDAKHDDVAIHWMNQKLSNTILFIDDTKSLNTCLQQNKVDVLYCIKYGTNDRIYSTQVKTVVHCVFDMSEPHGDVYAGVSETLVKKYNQMLYVPHMIPFQYTPTTSLRKEYNIPENAHVFGRHGGQDTFNISFVQEYISKIIRKRIDIYFMFINAPVWDKHPQLIYLPPTTDIAFKQRFITTCDAMIVPEAMGHTFGLSIMEFCIYNKPIICYRTNMLLNDHHIQELQEEGIYFSNQHELSIIVESFHLFKHIVPITAYKKYTPEYVMSIFERVFLL